MPEIQIPTDHGDQCVITIMATINTALCPIYNVVTVWSEPRAYNFSPNMTGFVSNIAGFVPYTTGFVQNMTGFVSNMIGFVPNMT